MTISIRTFALFSLIASTAISQGLPPSTDIYAGISPLPIWTGSETLANASKSQYAFFDPSTNELVLSVPQDSAIENGPRKVMRFNLHNGVDPSVSFTIGSTATGDYVYQYSVRNGPRARQSLNELLLFVPDGTQLSGSHSSWQVSQVPTSEPSRLPPPNAGNLTELAWRAPASSSLSPGSALGDFQLRSKVKPGFITVIARGYAATEYSEELASQLPDAAKAQVAQALMPAWDGKSLLILGPKFQPGTPAIAVAADFYVGITGLVHRRLLDAASPFVNSTLRSLQIFIDSQQAAFNPSLLDNTAAKPGVEQQIAAALSMSLSQ